MAKTKSFNPKLRLINFNASPAEATSQPAKSLEEQIREGETKLLKKLDQIENKLSKVGSKKHPADAKALQQELKALREEIAKLSTGSEPIKPKNILATHHVASDFRSQLSRALFRRILGYRKLKSEKILQANDINLNPATEEVDEFGRDYKFEAKIKPISDFFYYKYWRVSTHGVENVPHKGRALLVANHSGTLPFDGPMIRLAVNNDHPARRAARFLVEDFVYYLPFVGTFMYRVGGVRASQDNAERLLNKDHLVAVFPEGQKGIGKLFNKRYQLQRFGRGGFIKLAIRTNTPIIPVAVVGAEETHPLLYKASFLAKPFGIPYVPITPTMPWFGPLGFFGLPTKWTIYFGKPINVAQYGKKALDDDLLIHKLSEQVRHTIQEMLVDGLKRRKSIFFG
ncbi:MAG: acyltransferase family protein [Deltaproteobacteria bacterium]|nr:acyltransferase family protein [Deltaproteobacteria bacterium]